MARGSVRGAAAKSTLASGRLPGGDFSLSLDAVRDSQKHLYFRRLTSRFSSASMPGVGLRAATALRYSSIFFGMSLRLASIVAARAARVRSRLWSFGGMSARGSGTCLLPGSGCG